MTGPRVAAVILAGGKGERLGGVIKANLVIGGVRLLDRVTRAIAGAASPVLVAYGAVDPDLLALGERHIPIPDPDTEYAGPLAGVAAAIAWCETQTDIPDYLVSVAVDTPFFPPDFIGRALSVISTAVPAVVARYGDQDYPTNALWRLASVRGLPSRLVAGTAPRSLKRLAAELGARPLDWPQSAAGDPFANANTPADVLALQARAEAE